MSSGIEHGDRVALWAPNSLEWIVAALGVTTAGGVLVPVNTRFRGVEAGYVLGRSRARLLFTVRGFLETDYPAMLADAAVELPALEHTVLLSGEPDGATPAWDEFLGRGRAVADAVLEARVASIGPDDPSDIVFTSGTTGNPKGVVMTHGQTLRGYLDWCDWVDLRPGDRYLIANPFFHIFGYKAGVLASLMRGATILPVAVFDAGAVLELVEHERRPCSPDRPPSTTRCWTIPAGRRATSRPCACRRSAPPTSRRELVTRMHAELPFERILTGYGLTEAGTVTGARPDDDFEHIVSTVGVPLAGFEVRTVDEHGAETAAGEPGEVVVRGETVMRQYLDDPDATAAAIDADGWLHTGDLGVFDPDGYLRIIGRIKDMFIVGGFNAYPAEIENLSWRRPASRKPRSSASRTLASARSARPSSCSTPAPRSSSRRSSTGLADEMANYKVPRSVEFLDALPVNATGKVVKDELRARASPA